ncbi:hypothetical protein DV515_00007403 [Chloebia gouldiae]|uniref:Uncharacterized protein n=1 Tax=Chloebia gouldiae TaxID=44316 RepID=A0A3L8SJ61_CHLGU|nr:hypothetical protein DV515_00007403 [Chloebia gouldiae]
MQLLTSNKSPTPGEAAAGVSSMIHGAELDPQSQTLEETRSHQPCLSQSCAAVKVCQETVRKQEKATVDIGFGMQGLYKASHTNIPTCTSSPFCALL